MSYHFYAMLSRMKNIYRWGLMRNTKQESLSEHTLETAFVAHALSLIHNNRFGGNVDADRMAVLALFHDTSEIITGDMPTPIKYYNPEIKKVYKEIEKVAEDKLLSMLPDYLSDDLAKVYSDIDDTARLIIKAADKISAYIKCIEELKMGNQEFLTAKASTEEAIKALDFPAADVFLEDFMPSFMLSLDEQN